MRKSIHAEVRPEIGKRIRELRKRLHLTQEGLAAHCKVHQAMVARWESGELGVPGEAIAVMAKLAGEPDKWWWLGLLGIKEDDLGSVRAEGRYALVPLLKEAAAAGTGRIVTEKEIDSYLSFPKEWLPARNVTALKVKGDSMSPIIEDGYIVLVDTSQRDPARLIGSMVAAREDGGITIKWLRKEGKFYQLVPQHTSVRHPVRVLTADQDFGIVGRVVKWIGEPPK
jgi:SOS-response transcriptional repressor LexA